MVEEGKTTDSKRVVVVVGDIVKGMDAKGVDSNSTLSAEVHDFDMRSWAELRTQKDSGWAGIVGY